MAPVFALFTASVLTTHILLVVPMLYNIDCAVPFPPRRMWPLFNRFASKKIGQLIYSEAPSILLGRPKAGIFYLNETVT